MSSTRLTMTQLNSLPLPPNEFSLQALLPPMDDLEAAKILPGFESVEACINEDKRRTSALRKLPWTNEYCRWRLQRLVGQFEAGVTVGAPALTLASALYMREQRLRIVGAILQLIHDEMGEEMRDVALIKVTCSNWRVDIGSFYSVYGPMLIKRFRSVLSKAGVCEARGYLIAYLQGHLDPRTHEFRMQIRGICAGEKLNLLRELELAQKDRTSEGIATRDRDLPGLFSAPAVVHNS